MFYSERTNVAKFWIRINNHNYDGQFIVNSCTFQDIFNEDFLYEQYYKLIKLMSF